MNKPKNFMCVLNLFRKIEGTWDCTKNNIEHDTDHATNVNHQW